MSDDLARDRGGAKWDKAARYLRIMGILHGHPEGVGVPEIANELGVSKRTVYRDLAAMESDAELPIWSENGKWGVLEGAFLPPLALTLHEAMTLFLAARVLAKATDEQDTELMAAFRKLADILPPVLGEHVRATVNAYAGTPRNEGFTRVLRTLTEGWSKRRVVQIEYGPGVYDPTKAPRTTRVRPYAIEPSALTHGIYLLGHDEERGELRTFKVERIRSAHLTPEIFEAPPSEDFARRLLLAWDVIADEEPVRVVMRFTASVAARVAETRWHMSQVTEPQPDGSLIWSATVSGIREVRSWILGWGPDAEVLEPATLREEVARLAREAVDRYAEGSVPSRKR
jgi:predicted DNA-binding transcriptional regulator YafY